MQIPCPDETTATTIQQVLWVDRELRPQDVVKTAQVHQTPSGCVLDVYVVLANMQAHPSDDAAALAPFAKCILGRYRAGCAHDGCVPDDTQGRRECDRR